MPLGCNYTHVHKLLVYVIQQNGNVTSYQYLFYKISTLFVSFSSIYIYKRFENGKEIMKDKRMHHSTMDKWSSEHWDGNHLCCLKQVDSLLSKNQVLIS